MVDLLEIEVEIVKISNYQGSALRACSHDPGTTHCPGATH